MLVVGRLYERPYALLALLSEEPKYGLRLQSEFESRTGEVWPLNVGQVYTTLQRLERDGLVETDEERRAGAEALQDHRRRHPRAHRLAAHAARPVPPPRDELVIKVLVALQVPGTDIHEILQVHRRHAIEVMQRYTQIKASAAGAMWRSLWWPTRKSSGSKRSSAGSTPPTSASSGCRPPHRP